MELAGSWPLGSKNHPKTKEDGEWPDPALRCEITPRSHVFLFILFTLRFWKNGADSTQRWNWPATGHLAGPDAAFHLFLEAMVVAMISTLTEGLCMITAYCRLGTKRHAFYFSESGENFMEIFPASCGVKSLHAAIDNFSTGSQVTPPAWLLHLAKWKLANLSFIGITILWIFVSERAVAVSASVQSLHPDQVGRHYAPNPLKFIAIRKAEWGFPERRCCPCSDKWLPPLKRVPLLIWKSSTISKRSPH